MMWAAGNQWLWYTATASANNVDGYEFGFSVGCCTAASAASAFWLAAAGAPSNGRTEDLCIDLATHVNNLQFDLAKFGGKPQKWRETKALLAKFQWTRLVLTRGSGQW